VPIDLLSTLHEPKLNYIKISTEKLVQDIKYGSH